MAQDNFYSSSVAQRRQKVWAPQKPIFLASAGDKGAPQPAPPGEDWGSPHL